MKYLSPEIAQLAKKNNSSKKSLLTKSNSCGIFQDYGIEENTAVENTTEE